jgi:excisionase family DNA binding protein
VDLSVAEAAKRLGVHRSRVEQLLQAGEIAGRRAGRLWLVDGDALERWQVHPRAAWRPMAPARAWGLLDLLDGGDARWLSGVARSQMKAKIRSLRDADAAQWRGLLRRRSVVHQVRVHPAALGRLDRHPVLRAGAAEASRLGADLVVVDPVPEFYVRSEDWGPLGAALHAQPVATGGNLVVRVPRDVWPFDAHDQVGPAVLGADCLESVESRAVDTGLRLIRDRVHAWL